MLYFFPSMANVFVRPRMPALTVEYCAIISVRTWVIIDHSSLKRTFARPGRPSCTEDERKREDGSKYTPTEAGLRSHGDNTPVLLLEEDGPHSLGTLHAETQITHFRITISFYLFQFTLLIAPITAQSMNTRTVHGSTRYIPSLLSFIAWLQQFDVIQGLFS